MFIYFFIFNLSISNYKQFIISGVFNFTLFHIIEGLISQKNIQIVKKFNKIFIFTLSSIAMLSGASGEFTGWGDATLHHVADSKSVDFYGIQISKHIIMLLISVFVTILLSVISTKKYRNNINAKPSGLSQIFEILMDFINKEIVIPNIGKNYTRTWTPVAMTFLFLY